MNDCVNRIPFNRVVQLYKIRNIDLLEKVPFSAPLLLYVGKTQRISSVRQFIQIYNRTVKFFRIEQIPDKIRTDKTGAACYENRIKLFLYGSDSDIYNQLESIPKAAIQTWAASDVHGKLDKMDFAKEFEVMASTISIEALELADKGDLPLKSL